MYPTLRFTHKFSYECLPLIHQTLSLSAALFQMRMINFIAEKTYVPLHILETRGARKSARNFEIIFCIVSTSEKVPWCPQGKETHRQHKTDVRYNSHCFIFFQLHYSDLSDTTVTILVFQLQNSVAVLPFQICRLFRFYQIKHAVIVYVTKTIRRVPQPPNQKHSACISHDEDV